jgi:hypothetical protein
MNFKRSITGIVLLVILGITSCQIHHTYLLSYELDGQSYNHNEKFPQVMEDSEFLDEELVCVKYELGYNVPEFTITCIDSSLNETRFNAPDIEVKFKMLQGDSMVVYEYLYGKVDLKEIKRKEEIKATFHFKLINKNDTTDIIEINNGVFQGPLCGSEMSL